MSSGTNWEKIARFSESFTFASIFINKKDEIALITEFAAGLLLAQTVKISSSGKAAVIGMLFSAIFLNELEDPFTAFALSAYVGLHWQAISCFKKQLYPLVADIHQAFQD